MKVYVVESIETGDRQRVHGKGTRVYISKAAAIAKIWRNDGNRVAEYNLVPTGETWSK